MMTWYASLALVPIGCVGAETEPCPGGRLCPVGTNCRIDRGAEVCVPELCGNGVVEPGEDCDDGNATAGDACEVTCRATNRPTPRYGHAMTYDALNHKLVLFGGQGPTMYDETWTW